MAAALPLPLKATAGFYRYTHFLPPECYLAGVIVGVSQRLHLPRTAEKQKTKEKQQKTYPLSPPKKGKSLLHPYSSVPSGVSSTSISTSASPSDTSWAAGVSSSGVVCTAVRSRRPLPSSTAIVRCRRPQPSSVAVVRTVVRSRRLLPSSTAVVRSCRPHCSQPLSAAVVRSSRPQPPSALLFAAAVRSRRPQPSSAPVVRSCSLHCCSQPLSAAVVRTCRPQLSSALLFAAVVRSHRPHRRPHLLSTAVVRTVIRSRYPQPLSATVVRSCRPHLSSAAVVRTCHPQPPPHRPAAAPGSRRRTHPCA